MRLPSKRKIRRRSGLRRGVSNASQRVVKALPALSGELLEPNKRSVNLFEAENLMQFGDWEALAEIDPANIKNHPDRARLALLSAQGCLQLGELGPAQARLRSARTWGAPKKSIYRILTAGVYNSLGRASFLSGKSDQSLSHFSTSIQISMPGAHHPLSARARAQAQVEQLMANQHHSSGLLMDARVFTETMLPYELGKSLGQSDRRLRRRPNRSLPAKERSVQTVYQLLALLHEQLCPEMYLEIGVHEGRSIALCNGKAVGVDPVPRQRAGLNDQIEVVHTTSDDFFALMADEYLIDEPDLIFIDGMPLIENVLRDFINSERHSKSTTLILVANVLPRTAEHGMRYRTGSNWAGDTWKLVKILEEHRPDLFVLPVNVDEHGLLMVAGLNSGNKVLPRILDSIYEGSRSEDIKLAPPDAILDREGVTRPSVDLLEKIVNVLADAANQPMQTSKTLVKTLRSVVTESGVKP